MCTLATVKLIVSASLLRHGGHLLVRALGVLDPPFVLLVIVTTGIHFFVDAAAGTLVAALAATGSALITRPAGIAGSPRFRRNASRCPKS